MGVRFPLDVANPSRFGAAGLAVAVGIGYFVAARFGLALRAEPRGVALFWPAAGIAIGAMIAFGPSARLPIATAVAVATITSKLLITGNLRLGITFGLVCAGQALLTSWLIERWFGRDFKLEDVRQVFGFLVASTAGAVVAAIGAVAAVSIVQSNASPLDVWRPWFASCLLGTITVAPLLIGLAETVRAPPSRRELIEGSVALVILTALSLFLTSLPQGPWKTALPVALIFPILLWVAVRCRPVFAAAAAFVMTLAIIWSTIFSVGYFGDASLSLADRILAAQTLVLAGGLLLLILAALFAERRQNELILKISNDHLQLSNERLQLALGGAKLGAFSLDLSTGLLECDARTAHMHGHASPPRTIKEGRSFVHRDDRSCLDTGFANAQHVSGVWSAEYRVLPPPGHPYAGKVRWVAFDGSLIRNSDGSPVSMLGVTRDITDNKLAQQVIAERNAQLALAGRFALVGTFTFDVGSERMQVSPGYTAIHGLPEGTEDISRNDWRRGVHPDDLPLVEAHFKLALAERRREHYCEYRILHAGGEIRWIDSRSFISYHHNGAAPRLVGANIDITQRKQAEALLKEHETRLADALVAGQVMAFQWDALTGQSRRSDNAALILGEEDDGGVGRRRNKFFTRVHPDDRDTFKQHLADLCEDTPSYAFSFRFRCPDGRQVWLEETAEGEFDATGKLLRIKGLTRDITERKRAEEKLHQSECELRELLGGLPAAIYVTDAAGRITYCNQAAIELWGATPRLGVDKWHELSRFYRSDGTVMPVDLCPTEIALKQGRIVRNLEAILERPDGARIPIIPYPTPLYDETGAIVGVVNMTVDISERKKAEAALDERNVQLALAGKVARVGSYAYDLGDDVMQISEGYAALHGLPEGTTETRRIDWRARAHPDDLARVEAMRRQALHRQLSEYDIEYRILRAEHDIRWIESRSFISYNTDGSPRRVVGINIDVTQRKRAEEYQRAMNAELDHRVKNVLATVSAIIAQTRQASRSHNDFVSGLEHRIRSLARTHELLSHSNWTGVSLAEIVRREFAPYSASRVEIDGPSVTLKAEAAQAVAMVIHELTTNAAKHGAFSSGRGRVLLRWWWLRNGSDGRLAIRWQETGGPPVLATNRTSYGTSIIRELIPFELGGVVDLALACDGLRCLMEIPAEWISARHPANDPEGRGLAQALASH